MEKLFNEIFWAVAEDLNIENWWELFDSENMDIVDEKCKMLENFDQEEYDNWYFEMCEEL